MSPTTADLLLAIATRRAADAARRLAELLKGAK